MATKTSTRGKTKTAKKPATKKVTARKTTSAAATRGRVSTKKTVAKASVSKKPVLTGLSRQLRTLAILTAVLSVVTAVLAAFKMNHLSYQLVTTLQTNDELLSTKSAVFVPAVRAVFDVELRWVVVAIMALTAVLPLLVLTRLKDYYANGLKNRSNLLRWVDTAVISALMLETIALISGINDLMTLKLIAGLVITSVALTCITERQSIAAQKPNRSLSYLSMFTAILPWLAIAVAAVGTVVYGDVRAPWYVYALYATTLLGLVLTLRTHVRTRDGLLSAEQTERNYLQVSLFTRLAFGLILVLGLLK